MKVRMTSARSALSFDRAKITWLHCNSSSAYSRSATNPSLEPVWTRRDGTSRYRRPLHKTPSQRQSRVAVSSKTKAKRVGCCRDALINSPPFTQSNKELGQIQLKILFVNRRGKIITICCCWITSWLLTESCLLWLFPTPPWLLRPSGGVDPTWLLAAWGTSGPPPRPHPQPNWPNNRISNQIWSYSRKHFYILPHDEWLDCGQGRNIRWFRHRNTSPHLTGRPTKTKRRKKFTWHRLRHEATQENKCV